MDNKEETDNKKEMVDLTGHWFVNFGAQLVSANIEGSRILTLNGEFDPDDLLDLLVKHITDTLPDEAKKLIEKSEQRIVIRSFNRIDPPIVIGAKLT